MEAVEIESKQIRKEAKVGDDPKKKKYVALFQARSILAKIGTMQERSIAKKQLKRMKKLGIKSV